MSTTMHPRKLLSLLLLGFSSGLPLFLTSKTLQAWMTTEGVDLATIGHFSLVALPYSLKFLWAPFLDRYVPPLFGRRRGWLAIFQILLAISIAVMGMSNPRESLGFLAAIAVLVAFFSASQDIAFDAWRVDSLSENERGMGAATGVLGYRLALLLTGSAALMFAEKLTWQGVYLSLAVLQFLLVVVTWQASEPNAPPEAPKSLQDAVVRPFQEFWRARGEERAVAVLLFIVFFKWGVYLVSTMSTPFLLDLKFTMTEVGAVLGGAGLIATLLGTMAGGVALTRFKLLPALWIFGILQAACGLLFWGLALHGHNLTWMTFAVVAENFFMGMGTAALVAFLMQECDVRFSATQFALLSSLMAVGRDLLTAPAGDLAKLVGWPIFFLLTLVASVPGLLLLAWISRMPALPSQESHTPH